MRERSLDIAAAALLSAMAGIYCFMAGVALLIGGSVAAAAGSATGNLVFTLGAVFLAISFAAYFVGGGLWAYRSWAWFGAIVLFASVVAANLFLSVMAANFINLVLPAIGTVVVLAILSRPSVRVRYRGVTRPAVETSSAPVAAEVVRHLA